MSLNFNDTAKAFAYKSDSQLLKAKILFQLMQFAPLVKLGTILTPWAIRLKLPVRGIIKKTLFEQFVGGESLEKTTEITNQLASYGVDVILDYGVEGGFDDDLKFDKETQKFIEVIRFAKKSTNIPFISIKISGLTNTSLLESLNYSIGPASVNNCSKSFENQYSKLTEDQKSAWEKLVSRTQLICEEALKMDIGVMIDAEESWYQDAIDQLAYKMMEKYNTNKAVVYNTIQLYRTDRLFHLKSHLEQLNSNFYYSGLKLVRGAYMEKERERAEKMGYPSPIQPDKMSTDRDYNAALQYCIERKNQVTTIVASHNEESTRLATDLVQQTENNQQHISLHFSQLYGMSDNLTFNLADAGYHVSKYLPFGPIEEVIPYLMRRAQENSSVSGQTGREFELLRAEYLRRKKAKKQ